MVQLFSDARVWLSSHVDPAAPAASLIVLTFLFVWLLRRSPKIWGFVERTLPVANKLDPGPLLTVLWKSWQALPGMLFAAAVAALSTGGSVKAALAGVGLAALTSFLHEAAKIYKGQAAAAGIAMLLCMALAFHSIGCALGEALWPIVKDCAPSAATLVNQVEGILVAGGDYATEFEQIALADGTAALQCAVKEAIADLLSSHAKFSPNVSNAAAARGKAFLASKGIPL